MGRDISVTQTYLVGDTTSKQKRRSMSSQCLTVHSLRSSTTTVGLSWGGKTAALVKHNSQIPLELQRYGKGGPYFFCNSSYIFLAILKAGLQTQNTETVHILWGPIHLIKQLLQTCYIMGRYGYPLLLGHREDVKITARHGFPTLRKRGFLIKLVKFVEMSVLWKLSILK